MIHHWLTGVRDTLVASLTSSQVSDPSHNILVMPDGQPAATAGIVFIAIHSQGASQMDSPPTGPVSARVVYDLTCTISMRVRGYPHDKEGIPVYLKESSSLTFIAGRVRDLISNSLTLLSTVQSAAAAESSLAGVVEPLAWFNTGPVVPRGKDWYRSGDPYDADMTPAGYSIDVSFNGGKTLFARDCPEP